MLRQKEVVSVTFDTASLFRGKQELSLEIFLPVLNVKASRGRGREATTRQVVSLMNEGRIVGRKVWDG